MARYTNEMRERAVRMVAEVRPVDQARLAKVWDAKYNGGRRFG